MPEEPIALPPVALPDEPVVDMVPEVPAPEPVPTAPEPCRVVPLPAPLAPPDATDPLVGVPAPEPCGFVPLPPPVDEAPPVAPPDSAPETPLPLPQPARRLNEIDVVNANESRQAEITRALMGRPLCTKNTKTQKAPVGFRTANRNAFPPLSNARL